MGKVLTFGSCTFWRCPSRRCRGHCSTCGAWPSGSWSGSVNPPVALLGKDLGSLTMSQGNLARCSLLSESEDTAVQIFHSICQKFFHLQIALDAPWFGENGARSAR